MEPDEAADVVALVQHEVVIRQMSAELKAELKGK